MAHLSYIRMLMLTIGCAPALAFTTGDCAIVGFNMDSPDDYAVLLLADLPAGVNLTATDDGVRYDGSLRGSESHRTYTPGSSVPAGTVLTKAEFGSLSLSSSGDQVLVYTGSQASPTFICALNVQNSVWSTSSNAGSTSSNLPPGLVEGETAIAVPEKDNGLYDTDSAITTGSANDLRLAIHNAANWVTR